MVTASETTAAARRGLFEHKLPPRIILASFPFLTVPLVVIAFLLNSANRWFVPVSVGFFGLTHFVLTLVVYLQSENLKYFKASLRNILLFFVVPPAILMGFYVMGVLQINARFPVFAVVLGVLIRSLDFNHLNRQTYGVYQMFKARTGLRPPPSIKHFEQAYLACLTALLLTTFLAGGICPLPQVRGWRGIGVLTKPGTALLSLGVLQVVFVGLAGLAVVCAAISVGLLIREWNAKGRPGGILQALGYLGIQTFTALLATVNFPLYFATQPTHYVEYHVLMFPRCFHTELDERNGLDRWFGGLRRHRAVFYGAIVVASAVVMAFTTSSRSPSKPISYLAIVSLFDGLFVFHYFVEMLIWRFSDPFFRRTLGSLYFAPRLRTAQ
jgi:hypothetical protein